MFACTAAFAAWLGKPAVITPSNQEPLSELLLSPPVPSTIAPSCFIGLYPDGSGPSYHVVRPPDAELPPSSANVFCPLFCSMAVTNGVSFPVLLVFCPLARKMPFSRSASTHGPAPAHGGNAPHIVDRLSASMVPAPSSLLPVSTLPKSKQHPEFVCVPLATMYMPSGCPPRAVPCVASSRYPVPGSISTPYASCPPIIIGSAVAF